MMNSINRAIFNAFFLFILLTGAGLFAQAEGGLCRDLFPGELPGKIEVKPGLDPEDFKILYVEKDSSGNPVDRGYLNVRGNNPVSVSMVWVDGGAENFGKPYGLRGNEKKQNLGSLRGKGVSKQLFKKMDEIMGPGKTVYADMAYSNIYAIWNELRRLLKLPALKEINSMNDAKNLIAQMSDPKSSKYVPGFNERDLFKQALATTPFMKVWSSLGYTEFVNIRIEWGAAGSPDNFLPSVFIMIKKPGE